MFKFNFCASDQVLENGENMPTSIPKDQTKQESLKWQPSEEIFPGPSTHWDASETNSVKMLSQELIYVQPSNVLRKFKDVSSNSEESIFLAHSIHSDLVPALYEGGLKIWECTQDICEYLDLVNLNGKSVLDLGCGVGLLGVLALKLGAANVCFQDYNADVLHHATIPNVRLNTCESDISRCRFFSGDWESFSQCSHVTYDFILSSETIYNPDNHLKLHNAIQRLLGPDGVALVGTKTYYFGVGGSSRQFEKLVLSQNIFNVEVVWKSTEGVLREILKLTWKNAT